LYPAGILEGRAPLRDTRLEAPESCNLRGGPAVSHPRFPKAGDPSHFILGWRPPILDYGPLRSSDLRPGPALALHRWTSAKHTVAATEEGAMSQDDGRPWEGNGDLPWDMPDSEWESADSEAWRGDVHLGDWPENLAGPEYWLYKKEERDE
jgi:hypothetical protein